MPKKLSKILKYVLILAALFLLIGFFGYKKTVKISTPKDITPASEKTEPLYQDFHLVIPSLDISAPINADVNGKEKDAYFKALETGVAHYAGTKKPGEGGNVFIFGHSSYYFWKPGEYKEIFQTLPNIKEGDEIDIWWQSKNYKYKVSQTKVVEPTDVSVLKPTADEQLTLMTCVPPGTAEKRLIVIAEPIIL